MTLFVLGLEKLNDETTEQFYGATNKKNKSLDQLLLRRLRIDDYTFEL